ncbi:MULTISPECIES: ABC transporter ATP-binding protein [Halobacterium]|uniref:Nickel import system ATP-binding protein NikD n=5 Tax=Halobacterium salinarum TaxID=2242 RepID=A0A510N903_HALSA|nr:MULTISPECIES: ABC transporter ATP-binding protein [Halobacterium]MBB6089609.1 peptide/nickel transport system ATP-binding protein [Halobacterium salinarum]MCF2207793.1 ABC transporter ATP-binding protein [Halobacterium salinarum]MCF2238609.1 ABC transporter ATP-binding protein [Halobacterium salinarum]MDL0120985.1 ABC transporter ATP-binding protein [Halobacterium salinarum]MDL0141157.1 ABC transporter ATP-binding protein [Halobacterium salinarum]
MSEPLLSVSDLETQFHTDAGTVFAVDGVSFDVDHGETVAIVGESGSGKTVTSESITSILDTPPGEIVGGTITFDGMDLTTLSETALQDVRGKRISHIFQNPQNGLNPVYTVGRQIGEAIRIHDHGDPEVPVQRQVVDLLDKTGIPEASARVDDYPHEFSGGMKQRVLIAMALACDPDLLIADEPTTALDVTIQGQILRLLEDLQAEHDMGIIFVTHDLGVVSEIADRVVVMYAGKVMETGTVEDIFRNPSHPYTRALMDCLPGRGGSMDRIEGSLPDVTDPPAGCRFSPRCEHATEACRSGDQPPLWGVDDGDTHEASCVYYDAEHDEGELADGEDATGGHQ